MIAQRAGSLLTIAALVALCSCLGGSATSVNFPPATVTVSNVTSAACVHQSTGGVICTINLDVQLHNASVFDTLVTLGTKDTLTQQWLLSAVGQDINYGFPKSKLTRSDTGCLRAQDSIFVYDGPSAAYPIIASAAITPITLTCS